jgi:hypothetical protein
LVVAAIAKAIQPLAIESVVAPPALVIFALDFAAYKAVLRPQPFSYYLSIAVEHSFPPPLSIFPLSRVPIPIAVGLVPTALLHVHLPLSFVEITIQIVHFAKP